MTHDISINDDDIDPNTAATTTLMDVDFDSGAGGFSMAVAAGSNGYFLGSAASLTSANWTTDGTNTSTFAYTNDNDCNNCDKSADRLISPVFDATGYSSMVLTFDHAFSSALNEVLIVEVSTDGGTTWIPEANITNTSIDDGLGNLTTPWVNGVTVNLDAYVGNSNLRVSFLYNDAGDNAYGFAIDNILVEASSPVGIQETVNSSNAEDLPVKGNQNTYFYDPASGNVMGRIDNSSSWDYGCTTMEVDRDQVTVGATIAAFWNANTNNFLMAKTFYIDPSTNNTMGTYDVTFYFTEAEVAAWEVATGKSRNDLKIIKVQDHPISTINAGNYTSFNIEEVTATLGSFGSNVTLTASFSSGFSGFGFGDSELILNVTFLHMTAKRQEDNILINWTTETETNNNYFIVERSVDGIEFSEIDRVDGAGTSSSANTYAVLDENPMATYNYYRIQAIDFDGSVKQSKVVAVDMGDPSSIAVELSPNPVNKDLNVRVNTDLGGTIRLEVYDVIGQQVTYIENLNVLEGENQVALDVSDWAEGIYLLRISQGAKNYNRRFIKQ
ncbi:MAG: T9SS type A sorting domain-containing protein [Aureispira sp.]|nr:T9SS type A sorting domain-containing protein [Aureispira sp.]